MMQPSAAIPSLPGRGLLAFDLYYSFRDYTSDEEIYTLFKETIDNRRAQDACLCPESLH